MELKDVDFQSIERVKLLVEAGGGQTKLAHTLGFTPHNGRNRVQHWITEGKIPVVEVLRFNKVFKKIIRRYATKAL